MPDHIGKQLGNYRLTRLLGQGGFAEVYHGEHIYLNTQAAIKVLRTTLGTNDMEQFLSEARTVARLKHPHIVHVLDFGVENGTPFLVMEYAAKGTVRDHYPRKALLPLTTIRQYVQQIASALQYAHDQKLVHRDIKPENMLLGEHDELLLSDFGIATAALSSRYEQIGAVAGTGAYMAPEQLQGKPRPASDQYSLAVVIYEWLTGDLPFQGSFLEIASQHMLAAPPSLLERLPLLSPAIAEVVKIALAKEPGQRFASVQAFAKAFDQACQQSETPSAEFTVPRGSSWSSSQTPQTQQPSAPNSWMYAPTTIGQVSTPAALPSSGQASTPTPPSSFGQANAPAAPFSFGPPGTPTPPPTFGQVNIPAASLGDLPTVLTNNGAIEPSAPRSETFQTSAHLPPRQPDRPASRAKSSWGRRLFFIGLGVVLLASLTVASLFVFRGSPPQTNTVNVSATKTAIAAQPYLARIPGPQCDTGAGKWSSYGTGSMQCLADALQLTGASQAKFAVAFSGVSGITGWPVNFTVSVEVSFIQSGACVDLLDSIAPQYWYRIYLCSDDTAIAQFDDGKQTTSLQSLSVSPSDSFTLKISCSGSLFTFFVNGMMITSKDHGQAVSTLGIGLGAISGTANFKNFLFTPQP